MTNKQQVEEKDQQPTTKEATKEETTVETATEVSAEERLQHEKDALQAQVAELKDKYMRKVAEFENFRKRTMRERLELTKTAARDTMSVLLPVLDDFDRAAKSAGEEGLGEGTEIVLNKLHKVLEQKGLQAMESNGKPFDPELHEAITEIPAPTEELKGKIVDTVEKGYYLGEKIIRYAKVVVGK
ncbi:MAG: nucleotide exchange factor GrpE [Bacteroidota bacterium]